MFNQSIKKHGCLFVHACDVTTAKIASENISFYWFYRWTKICFGSRRATIQICWEIYKPTANSNGMYLSLCTCTTTACEFREHFLKHVKYIVSIITPNWIISIDCLSRNNESKNRTLHFFRKAFFCKLLDKMRKQRYVLIEIR